MRAGEWPRQRGYTYLLVLFMIAALGLLAAQAGVVWQMQAQRERETELLAVGVEIARALARYRDETPVGSPAAPATLEALVEDGRFPVPRRHLRRIYRDPLSGRAEWGLVREGERIVGVHSLSEAVPIRRADLPPELGSEAEHAASYRAWIFRPQTAGATTRSPIPPARTTQDALLR